MFICRISCNYDHSQHVGQTETATHRQTGKYQPAINKIVPAILHILCIYIYNQRLEHFKTKAKGCVD